MGQWAGDGQTMGRGRPIRLVSRGAGDDRVRGVAARTQRQADFSYVTEDFRRSSGIA